MRSEESRLTREERGGGDTNCLWGQGAKVIYLPYGLLEGGLHYEQLLGEGLSLALRDLQLFL